MFNMFSAIMFFVLSVSLLSSFCRAERKVDLSVEVPDAIASNGLSVSQNSSVSFLSFLSLSSSLNPEEDFVFSFHAYRGDTLKRTVYFFVEDSFGKKVSNTDKVSLPSKYYSSNYTVHLELKTTICNSDTYRGPFFLVLFGLGVENKTRVFIGCPSSDSPEESSSDDLAGQNPVLPQTYSLFASKPSFEIIGFPSNIYTGSPFTTRVVFHNPSERFFDISAWSYVYRSSRCYSGFREQNKKEINIPPHSNVTFELVNTVLADPGNYSFKLKILIPPNKLPKEITRPVVLFDINENSDDASALSIKHHLSISDAHHTSKDLFGSRVLSGSGTLASDSVNSSLVYLSSSAKAKRLLPFLIILALALLLVVLVIRNF